MAATSFNPVPAMKARKEPKPERNALAESLRSWISSPMTAPKKGPRMTPTNPPAKNPAIMPTVAPIDPARVPPTRRAK